jgi:hypothetical protein
VEVVLIAAALACIIGWHVSRAHMSHRGIPVRRGQLRDYRKDRLRQGLRFVALAILLGVILLIAFH